MGDSARLCLFCFEKRTNRQKIFCVENLFGCECKVYCHSKCIKKWHYFCGDDLQCPICRRSIAEDDELEIIQAELIVIQVEINHRQENIKRIVLLLIQIILFCYCWNSFTFQRSS
jgi:hypothetical protein